MYEDETLGWIEKKTFLRSNESFFTDPALEYHLEKIDRAQTTNYNSQFGLQGFFVAYVAWLSPLDTLWDAETLQYLVSGLWVVAAALLIGLTKEYAGLPEAVVLGRHFLFSPLLTMFSKKSLLGFCPLDLPVDMDVVGAGQGS